MALIQRGFQTYDGNHAPDFVKNGNFFLNKNSSQARGLVGWWPDAFGGTTLIERSERGHAVSGVKNGTPGTTSAVSPTPDGIKAAFFDGVGTNNIFLGRWDDQMNGLSAYTVTMSVITTNITFNDFDSIIIRGPNNVRSPWIFAQNTTAGLNFNSENSVGGNSVATGGTLVNGKIHHLACVWEASTRHELIIDNVIVATDVSPHPGTMGTVSTEVRLGTRTNTDDEWFGTIWDIRLYNRALSALDIRSISAPSARWDLYHELVRKTYFVPAVAPAGGRVMSSLAGYGGLAGHGGIAGAGGGLAG